MSEAGVIERCRWCLLDREK